MFIRKGLMTRRPPKFETKVTETMCVAFTICKKKKVSSSLGIDLLTVTT